MRYLCMAGGFIVALGLVGCGKAGVNCSQAKEYERNGSEFAYMACVHPDGKLCHHEQHEKDGPTVRVCQNLDGSMTSSFTQTTDD